MSEPFHPNGRESDPWAGRTELPRYARRIALPELDSPEYLAQQILMVELLVDPADEGDPILAVAHRLGRPLLETWNAICALEAAGLVTRLGRDRVRATDPLLYFAFLVRVSL